MLRLVAGLAALATLSACASPYVSTPYDRGPANIQSIAIMDDSLPDNVAMYQSASVGSNFGLIGALADGVAQAGREGRLKTILDKQSFDSETVFEQALATSLGAQNYTTSSAGQARKNRAFVEKYPAGADGKGAYLDVAVINYGYLAAGFGTPYRPAVTANVRLMSADNKMLMDNRIEYNPLMAQQGVIALTPNPEYSFMNIDEMEKAPPGKVTEGLKEALTVVADTIANLLK